MSYSTCFNCGKTVGNYQKWCQECLDKYDLNQSDGRTFRPQTEYNSKGRKTEIKLELLKDTNFPFGVNHQYPNLFSITVRKSWIGTDPCACGQPFEKFEPRWILELPDGDAVTYHEECLAERVNAGSVSRSNDITVSIPRKYAKDAQFAIKIGIEAAGVLVSEEAADLLKTVCETLETVVFGEALRPEATRPKPTNDGR